MRVAILATGAGALFELGCAVEIFGLPRPEYTDWYQAEVVSFGAGTATFTTGIKLVANKVRVLDSYEMLVIPSWPTTCADQIPAQLSAQIRQFHQDRKRIISFCSGAFLLAELGILNGRRATTHWRYAALFKQRFPEVEYVDDVLYVYDGQLGCSAGSAAALDLGIEVVRHDFGYKAANQVARRLVLSSHRQGGQSQFVETPVLAKPDRFAEALDWAINNLAAPIEVNAWAQTARMSRRTFDRKFRAALNLSPNEWLTEQRLSLAKGLLEDSNFGLDKIATLAGFGNAITMRHHFRNCCGISPKQYRDQFCRNQGNGSDTAATA